MKAQTLPNKKLISIIHGRVKELFLDEIDKQIMELEKMKKENPSLNFMLNFIGIDQARQERRREICRKNGLKGGAPKGNQNARKKEKIK